jgi:hypothetical protein
VKKLFIFLSVILILCCGILCTFAAGGYIIDDRSELMHYTSSSRIYIPSAVNGSVSSLTSGNSVSFQIWGSEFSVYCASYTNSGYVAVYVDNVLKGVYDVGQSTDYVTSQLLCSFTDLSEKEHNIVLVCTSDYVIDAGSGRSVLGRFYLDYVETSESFSDYYSNLSILCLSFIVLLLIFLLVFKICEFWRHLKHDN